MLPVCSVTEKLLFQPGETDSINSSYFINRDTQFWGSAWKWKVGFRNMIIQSKINKSLAFKRSYI